MITIDLIKSKYNLIKPRLDEKTRRLWAAIEANSIGRGGITSAIPARYKKVV